MMTPAPFLHHQRTGQVERTHLLWMHTRSVMPMANCRGGCGVYYRSPGCTTCYIGLSLARSGPWLLLRSLRTAAKPMPDSQDLPYSQQDLVSRRNYINEAQRPTGSQESLHPLPHKAKLELCMPSIHCFLACFLLYSESSRGEARQLTTLARSFAPNSYPASMGQVQHFLLHDNHISQENLWQLELLLFQQIK